MFGTTIGNCSFASADLKSSGFGGIYNGKRNIFRNIDFTNADLRGSVYSTAEFSHCTFRNTKLSRIDFQGSSFTDCSFEGTLREVCFSRFGFGNESFPPNEMARVDFTRAELRYVEFRGLDLADVCLPSSADHVIIENYRDTLQRLVDALSARNDGISKGLRAYFENEQKWAGPKQCRGVLNKRDLRELVGEEGLQLVLEIIRSSQA